MPPSDARELDVDFDEGVPLVAARVGDVSGNRFVLDTGSWTLLLTREIQVGHALRELATRVTGRARRSEYLEGGINEEPAVASFAFGPARFREVPARIEIPATRPSSRSTASSGPTNWPTLNGGSTPTATARGYAW